MRQSHRFHCCRLSSHQLQNNRFASRRTLNVFNIAHSSLLYSLWTTLRHQLWPCLYTNQLRRLQEPRIHHQQLATILFPLVRFQSRVFRARTLHSQSIQTDITIPSRLSRVNLSFYYRTRHLPFHSQACKVTGPPLHQPSFLAHNLINLDTYWRALKQLLVF